MRGFASTFHKPDVDKNSLFVYYVDYAFALLILSNSNGFLLDGGLLYNGRRYISPKSDLLDQGFDPEKVDIGDTCLVVFSYHAFRELTLSLPNIDNNINWPYHTTKLVRCQTKSGKYFSIHFPSYGSTRVANSLELLSTMSVRNVIGLGLGGTPQFSIGIGDIIFVQGSLRGDGASRYYSPIEYPAVADIELTSKLKTFFQDEGIQFKMGLSFGTDAFYRETEKLVEALRELNILIIDLESFCSSNYWKEIKLKMCLGRSCFR